LSGNHRLPHSNFIQSHVYFLSPWEALQTAQAYCQQACSTALPVPSGLWKSVSRHFVIDLQLSNGTIVSLSLSTTPCFKSPDTSTDIKGPFVPFSFPLLCLQSLLSLLLVLPIATRFICYLFCSLGGALRFDLNLCKWGLGDYTTDDGDPGQEALITLSSRVSASVGLR
jgi:hypothetical protein